MPIFLLYKRHHECGLGEVNLKRGLDELAQTAKSNPQARVEAPQDCLGLQDRRWFPRQRGHERQMSH